MESTDEDEVTTLEELESTDADEGNSLRQKGDTPIWKKAVPASLLGLGTLLTVIGMSGWVYNQVTADEATTKSSSPIPPKTPPPPPKSTSRDAPPPPSKGGFSKGTSGWMSGSMSGSISDGNTREFRVGATQTSATQTSTTKLDDSGTAPIHGSEKWYSCAKMNMHTCSTHCCCDPGYFYSHSKCIAETWLIKNFYKGDVAKEMLYTNCQGVTAAGLNMPKEFGGLWWMDGNPAPETVASFGHALWYPGTDGCNRVKLNHYTSEEKKAGILKDQFGDTVPCQGSMIVPFWQDRIWSMPDTGVGRAYEKVGTQANSNMEFVCGGPSINNLTICKIGASAGADGTAWYKKMSGAIANAGGQSFNALANFAMVKVNQDYWIRYSLSDGSYPYYLKHIVTCDGRKGKYWDLYMSGGSGTPPKDKDVYGHGGDTRTHVAKVTDMQIIRWNTHPPPVGSGWTCSTDTGGTCAVLGCKSWHGKTVCKDNRCLCASGYCQENGVCSKTSAKCQRDTGGTCSVAGCASSRGGASCINGACMCKEGTCAINGTCPSTYGSTGPTKSSAQPRGYKSILCIMALLVPYFSGV